MRGTWVFPVAVGRIAFNVCGLGADGRIAPGMFWKSGLKRRTFVDPSISLMVTGGTGIPKLNHMKRYSIIGHTLWAHSLSSPAGAGAELG